MEQIVNNFAQEVKRILLPIDPDGSNRLDFASETFFRRNRNPVRACLFCRDVIRPASTPHTRPP
jgi:hypothetical protein